MSKAESADLILKLYDLRREDKMREARNWIFSFNPTTVDEYWATMMDPQVGGYLRMVTSYWDMAASLVNHGAIDAEMFNDTARKSERPSAVLAGNRWFGIVFDRIKKCHHFSSERFHVVDLQSIY